MYTVKRTAEFDTWLASIRDGLTRIRLAERLDKVQRGLLGDVEPVGEGVCEMREFFGPGWRMYYHLPTPALAEHARVATIYKDQKFSDHAPLTIDYGFKL